MKTIEFTDYELNDLCRFLENAKEKKQNDYKNGKINLKQYQYELGLVKDLIAKVTIKSYQKKNKKEQTLKLI